MNFTELYNKIKALDEAGPVTKSANWQFDQENDPAWRAEAQRQREQEQWLTPAERAANERSQAVRKAQFNADISTVKQPSNQYDPSGQISKEFNQASSRLAQRGVDLPGLVNNEPNTIELDVGPGFPDAGGYPSKVRALAGGGMNKANMEEYMSDDWEESMHSENQPDPAAARAARSSMANALANAPEPTLSKEGTYDECGDMMGSMPPAPKQQDNVTMNVSMNGSGSGGIKDLMAILKNIESGKPAGAPNIPHDRDALFGDSYENSVEGSADTVTLDVADITPTGDDMHSKGNEAPKVNGGGNPMQEALKSRLAQMYDEIKEASHQEKTTMKHIKNPTAGEKKAAKDIKPGVKGYKDRIDMLKSAENDSRLKD